MQISKKLQERNHQTYLLNCIILCRCPRGPIATISSSSESESLFSSSRVGPLSHDKSMPAKSSRTASCEVDCLEGLGGDLSISHFLAVLRSPCGGGYIEICMSYPNWRGGPFGSLRVHLLEHIVTCEPCLFSLFLMVIVRALIFS